MREWTTSEESIQPLSRRQFFTAVTAGAGTGGLGSWVIGNHPASGASESPPEMIAERAQGLPESAVPYPVWQYHHNSDGNDDEVAAVSPINVVFPLEAATVEDVIETMEGAGWTESPLEYTLWAWNREAEQYERPHWSSAEAVFGLGGRLHIRAWHVEGSLSFQAHVDSALVPNHEVVSYADARATVEQIFAEAGWSVEDRIDLENEAPPDHDGLASVIRHE